MVLDPYQNQSRSILEPQSIENCRQDTIVLEYKEYSHSATKMQDLELLTKEAHETRIKNRKLQSEVEEKNEVINVLRDELDATKEQNLKLEKDLRQLKLDLKKFKTLQDEFDELKGKELEAEKLDLEIGQLKERLIEQEFLKLRITELQDDRQQAQEETAQIRDKWDKAQAQLQQVSEIEKELNKWRTFTTELQLERDSLQNKLLKSIDHETKLRSINKKAEEEVKRLRILVKNYEEKRDEEEASNSLIMSVADLKQIDISQQEKSMTNNHDRSHHDLDSMILDDSDIFRKANNFINDSVDASIQNELDKQIIEEFKKENEDLKEKINQCEDQVKNLTGENGEIKSQLETNRKLISELRQDLLCEKKITSKLNIKLTNFTKQIKDLDKSYLPIHDTSDPINNNSIDIDMCKEKCSSQVNRDASTDSLVNDSKANFKSSITGNAKKADSNDLTFPSATSIIREKSNSTTSKQDIVITRKSSAIVSSLRSEAKEPKPLVQSNRKPDDDETQTIKATTTSVTNSKPRVVESELVRVDEQDDESDDALEHQKRAPTPVKSRGSIAPRSNFVRNALPSRSVNYGHSRSFVYMDRVQASVQDKASSFTSGNRNSSANGQQTQLSPVNALQHAPNPIVNPSASIRQSRQLNALIDPFNHDHLMMINMSQQQNQRQQELNGVSIQQSFNNIDAVRNGQNMTEQELAHIHHQHYLHHLEHIRKLHHFHHHQLHLRLHQQHKLQQEMNLQQHQQQHQMPSNDSGLVQRQVQSASKTMYTGGSPIKMLNGHTSLRREDAIDNLVQAGPRRAHSSTPSKRTQRGDESNNKSSLWFEYGCV